MTIDFNMHNAKPNDGLFYHRVAEAFKFAFAERMSLGDDRFVNVTAVSHNSTVNVIIWLYQFIEFYECITHAFALCLQIVNRLISTGYAHNVRSKINDSNVLRDLSDYFLNDFPRAGSRDEGTAHFSAVAPDGSAASITSTTNNLYATILFYLT